MTVVELERFSRGSLLCHIRLQLHPRSMDCCRRFTTYCPRTWGL